MKKIILNQKSYFKYDEMVSYKKEFEKINPNNYEFIILPPLQYLSMFKDSKYIVGTQNFYSYKTGSFTGELNLESLKSIGVSYTLVGHFERKKLIEESYSMIKEKLFKSLNSKFDTILCVGESNKTKKPFSYIKKELNYLLRDIESQNVKYLHIAYEPNWAVGSGYVQDIEKIKNTISQIKDHIMKKYSVEVDVFYGGSIGTEDIKDIFEITDGIILGKVSTNMSELKELLGKLNS